jgi:hypothetical protein
MTENTLARPSTPALVGFVIVALVLPPIVCAGQWAGWMSDQIALTSASLSGLGTAGKIEFVIQITIVATTASSFFAFSRNSLRPIYQGWFLASLLTIPMLVLRFLGPNQDQIGALLQLVLGLIGAATAFFVRRRELRFNPRATLAALTAGPLIIWPFLIWGAVGSASDIVLNMLAGLAFGLMAACLISTSAPNGILNSLGIMVLLVILGSAFGYDGGQLLLLTLLPPFAIALATLSPSVAATAVGLGLLTAAPLVFVDPTELGIILGDFFPWAIRMLIGAVIVEFVVGAGLWLVSQWKSRPQTIALPATTAGVAWFVALILFVILGQKGFHGDRIFVIFKDQADVSGAVSIKDRNERLTFVYRTLTDRANTTQANIRQILDRVGVRHHPYYLVNALEVEGGTLVRLYLSTQPEVDRILDSPRLRPLPEGDQPSPGEFTTITENPGWNITMIGADKVWEEFGATGQGIVVGQSDSGVDGDHPALHDSYRGLETGNDYNWYDPWDGTQSPNDEGGHGTHTLGTILGKGGIGVAPGAQWIGCVNLDRNLGNPALYLDCLQFMLAPFPQNGNPFTDGDPTKAAYVLNNSWGCPPLEGCDPNALKPAVEALRAAGIFVVASAGNDGPACETVNSPLASYDAAFSVGAIDQSGDLAFFSSRGPVTVDKSGRIKPDIAAPGVDVFSSLPGGTYGANSGTSMAGPHLVGVVALLWSAQPDLIGDIDRTEQIIIQTAHPYTGTVSQSESTQCEDNDGVGYGIVNVYDAVKLALGK